MNVQLTRKSKNRGKELSNVVVRDISELERLYLAGIVDGCARFSLKYEPSFCVRLRITNKDIFLLENIKLMLNIGAVDNSCYTVESISGVFAIGLLVKDYCKSSYVKDNLNKIFNYVNKNYNSVTVGDIGLGQDNVSVELV